ELAPRASPRRLLVGRATLADVTAARPCVGDAIDDQAVHVDAAGAKRADAVLGLGERHVLGKQNPRDGAARRIAQEVLQAMSLAADLGDELVARVRPIG